MVNVHVLTQSRSWWSLVVRGLAAAIFGIIAIANPGGTLEFVVRIFGILLLVAGVAGMLAATRHHDESKKWGWLAIPAIVAVILGIILILVPGAIAKVFIFLVGLGLAIYAVWAIYNALRVWKALAGEWMPLLVGVVALVVGILLMFKAGAIAAGMMWLLGILALILGILWVVLGIRARGWSKRTLPVVEKLEDTPDKQ
jgi:uncharacterized membrane protein HdeD (DUF308 family)